VNILMFELPRRRFAPEMSSSFSRNTMAAFVCSIVEALERRTLLSTIPFTAATDTLLGQGTSPAGLAAGDFNNDGIADLVVADTTSGAARDHILIGNGNGTFRAAPDVLFGASVRNGKAVIVGDFNHDGNLDFAQGAEASDNSGGVVLVSLGKGDGTFLTPVQYHVRSMPTAMLWGGNVGVADAANAIALSTGQVNSASDLAVVVLPGNGDGTFGAEIDTPVTHEVDGLAAADFNGDGKTDLATPFGVQLGNGDGTFQAPQPLPNGQGLDNIVAGDFNNDGKMDLALAPSGASQQGVSGAIDILTGNGNGTFVAAGAVVIGNGVSDIQGLAIADLNGDGNLDLVTSIGPNSASHPNSVAVLAGQGGDVFAAADFFTTGTGTGPLALGDFTADGRPDIATANTVAKSISSLVNGSTTAVATHTALSASTLSAPFGTAIQLTATVTASSATPGAGSALIVTQGNVTILADGAPVGNGALNSSGKFTVPVNTLAVGTHTITASYAGTTNFAPSSTASAITITITGSGGGGGSGTLDVAFTSIKLPSVFVPGDKGSVKLAISNGTNGAISGKVAIQLFASTDGAIDANSVQIPAKSLNSKSLKLKTGKGTTASATFTVPLTLAIGTYQLLAKIVPISGIDASLVPAPTASAAAQAVHEFGSFSGRKNVKLVLPSGGGLVTYSLSGAGSGTVGNDGGITLTGSSSASKLTITAKGTAPVLPSIIADGAIGSITASTTTLTGTLSSPAAIGKVTIAALSGATIAAPTIASLTIKSGVANSHILAGVQLGADNALGGGNDTFAAGTMGTIKIGGAVTASIIGAGLDPVDGVFLNGNDQLLPGGSIKSFSAGGLSADSKVLAASLPATAKVGGAKVTTASDPRFHF
jgi:hypothetical protein